ncbi:hypothetical protein D6783_05575, partial [Candidatus Woesearchaeota archaeon]
KNSRCESVQLVFKDFGLEAQKKLSRNSITRNPALRRLRCGVVQPCNFRNSAITRSRSALLFFSHDERSTSKLTADPRSLRTLPFAERFPFKTVRTSLRSLLFSRRREACNALTWLAIALPAALSGCSLYVFAIRENSSHTVSGTETKTRLVIAPTREARHV